MLRVFGHINKRENYLATMLHTENKAEGEGGGQNGILEIVGGGQASFMTPFVNILPYHTSNSKNSNCKKKRHVSKKANVSNT